MTVLRQLFLGIFMLFIFSCHNDDKVRLQIHVKDDTGKLMGGAVISLNGNEIGRSDANGLFVVSMPLKKGEHRLEVAKASESSKYVSFKQDILYYRDEDKKINIDAILYSAPKWSYQGEESKKNDDIPMPAAAKPKPKVAEQAPEEAKALAVPQVAETPAAAAPKSLNPAPQHPKAEKVEPKAAFVASAKPVVLETVSSKTAEIPTENHHLLKEVDHLLMVGKIVDAVTMLKAVSANAPEYIEAWQKVGEIYLSLLDDPEQALAAYNKLTSLPLLKKYDKPKYLRLYIDKAIAYFDLGELKSSESKKEAALMFRNTHWITTHIAHLLKKTDDKEQLGETIHYYKALSLHRVWQLNPTPVLREKVAKEWVHYQAVAKKHKTLNHETFFANSAVYLKETM